MGEKVEPRREYIIEHAEFNKADHFDKQLEKGGVVYETRTPAHAL